MSTEANIFLIFSVVAVAIIGLFFWLSAPCSWFGWMAVTDVPARCIAEFAHPKVGR